MLVALAALAVVAVIQGWSAVRGGGGKGDGLPGSAGAGQGSGTGAPQVVAAVLGNHGVFPSELVLVAGRPYELALMGTVAEQQVDLSAVGGPDRVVLKGGQVAQARVSPSQEGRFVVQRRFSQESAEAANPAPLVFSVVKDPSAVLSGTEPQEVALLLTPDGLVPQQVQVFPGELLVATLSATQQEAMLAIGPEGRLVSAGSQLSVAFLEASAPGPMEVVCLNGCPPGAGAAPTGGSAGLSRGSSVRTLGTLMVQAPPRTEGGDLPVAPFVGYAAPDLVLKDLDGREVRLSELWRAKPVLINFWATWCPPCREEMPAIQAFYQADAAAGARMAVVGIDMQESPEEVRSFLKEGGYTYPVLMDPDGSAAQRFRVRGIPTTFFIDREGVVRVRFVGPMTREMIQQFARQAGLD